MNDDWRTTQETDVQQSLAVVSAAVGKSGTGLIEIYDLE